MSNTNDMRQEFEAWFKRFYNQPVVRDGNSYEIESIGRWIAWQAATERATAIERERCAKVCESRFMGDLNREDMEARRCAANIRQVKPI